RRPARLPERGIDRVWIARRHRERGRSGILVFEKNFTPRYAAVGRLEHAAFGVGAVCDVGTHVGFTAADVDDAWIARRDRDGTDRRDILLVEDRSPGAPGVVTLPDAAVKGAKVEVIGSAGTAGTRYRAPAAKRPGEPP